MTTIKPEHHPRSVLVVDDDDGVRAVLAECVSGLGYRTLTARGADEALDILRTQKIDVALIDIVMPGRDGVWLIRAMQAECIATAIIVATGVTEMHPAVTLSPGVIAYVTKPFDFDRVESAIDAAVASQQRMELTTATRSRLMTVDRYTLALQAADL